jgi:LacI family repressor for deo operon, udp, cdd, tsx, nupC, and nupG
MSTIKEVAAQAKVSTATVSRVLAHPQLVHQKTRERVLRAVEALGYEPNHSARSLRTQSTAKIIVTVPDISNPFFASVVRGVEEAAQRGGYSVLLGDTRNERGMEEQYASMLLRKEADGLIFFGHRLADCLKPLISKGGAAAPIVNGCEYSPHLGVHSVHIDNVRAAYEATGLLHSMGHTRIALLSGPRTPITRDRFEGVRLFAAEHGFEGRIINQPGDYTVESGARDAAALLAAKDRPTAFFCFSDELAMGALAAIRDKGLRCPEDISLIGFDDIRYARFVSPALTTIRQPMALIGQTAVERLLHILDGEGNAFSHTVLPHDLIVRASTGPAPGRTGART